MRIGPISTGGAPGGAAGACAKAVLAGFWPGEMVSGAASPGAIVWLSVLVVVALAGLRLAAVFLRALVESKPVLPAPEAGANVGGGPNRVADRFVGFWNVGGFDGSVWSFGVSGSGNWNAVCARAGPVTRQAAAISSAAGAAVLDHSTFRDVSIANLRQPARTCAALPATGGQWLTDVKSAWLTEG